MDVNDKELPLYTISTAAELLGISIHTLRMYEREGLVLPFKKESGHRLYSDEDIDRIKCIRRAINESKISIAGIKTIYSLIPCWKLINCPTEEKENCPAFTTHSKPCWTFHHNGNVCATNECKKCTVYRNYSECGKIKESIASC
jgi:MerR family transcriptional regulator, heat shock protein HspR